MEVDTLVSLVILVTTIVGSHAMLRRDLRAEMARIETRIEARLDRIESRLDWLTEQIFEITKNRTP